MSFPEITDLLVSAQQALTAAKLEKAGRAGQLRKDARLLLAQAGSLAEATQPEVVHPREGLGVVLGVTSEGLLEVTFGGDPFTVQLAADEVEPW